MTRYVTWKPAYSVGHATLDEQHRQILDTINDLYIALDKGDDRRTLDRLLKRLVQYTKMHFAFEESVMRECGYPDLKSHQQLHESLRQKTVGLQEHAALVTGHDLLGFLKEWWLTHIQEEDQRYSPYLTASVAP